jgi:transcriptional regulator with XRE-family HTH domain
MDLKARVEAAIKRAGIPTVAELARRMDIEPPSIFQVLNGSRSGFKTIQRIAELTGVSEHWLRDGAMTDAPEWAKDPLLLAMSDAQEAVRRLQVVTAERDVARAERDAALAELAQAKDALAKLALRLADEPEPVRMAASARSRYRIGQTKPIQAK